MSLSLSTLNPFNYLPEFLNPFSKNEISKQSGPMLYFDFCRMQYWKLNSPTLIETYLNDLMDQFDNAHINQLALAFAQISNIDDLANKSASDPNKDLFGYIITHYPNVFSSFVDQAHQHDIRVLLSFGGQTSSSESFLICEAGEDPTHQAQKLIDFISDNKLDGINFDLEGSGLDAFVDQNPQTLLPFLSTLNALLHKSNQTLSLTVEANHQSIQKLSKVFFNDQGQPQFQKYFDGLYLMNYDNGSKYYIDASNQDDPSKNIVWGMKKWIDTLSQDNTTSIHIGFQDATPYEDPTASAGKRYTINTKDRSQAAYMIYKQLEQDLKNIGYTAQFSDPFFWPDENVMGNRYNITTEGKGDFQLQIIQKFYEYTKQNQTIIL